MATNILMEVLQDNGNYAELYPKTDYNLLENKPTIPSVPDLPLSISNGGTGVTSLESFISDLNSNGISKVRIGNFLGSVDYNASQTITCGFPLKAVFIINNNSAIGENYTTIYSGFCTQSQPYAPRFGNPVNLIYISGSNFIVKTFYGSGEGSSINYVSYLGYKGNLFSYIAWG